MLRKHAICWMRNLLVQVAEQKQDMNKITESNALKRKCEEKDKDKKKLEEALKILAEKRKTL